MIQVYPLENLPSTREILGHRVRLRSLAVAFFSVSLFGFGGGIVWARRITVERRGWLAEPDFLDIVSLAQLMPGPNILGIAVCTGARLRGLAGALAAAAGFLLIPWSVGLAVGVFFLSHARSPLVGHILGGVSAAAAGLLIATGARLLMPHRRRPVAVLVTSLTAGLMAFAGLPLPVVLLGLAPLSLAATAIGEKKPS
jgi:chromate transporter